MDTDSLIDEYDDVIQELRGFMESLRKTEYELIKEKEKLMRPDKSSSPPADNQSAVEKLRCMKKSILSFNKETSNEDDSSDPAVSLQPVETRQCDDSEHASSTNEEHEEGELSSTTPSPGSNNTDVSKDTDNISADRSAESPSTSDAQIRTFYGTPAKNTQNNVPDDLSPNSSVSPPSDLGHNVENNNDVSMDDDDAITIREEEDEESSNVNDNNDGSSVNVSDNCIEESDSNKENSGDIMEVDEPADIEMSGGTPAPTSSSPSLSHLDAPQDNRVKGLMFSSSVECGSNESVFYAQGEAANSLRTHYNRRNNTLDHSKLLVIRGSHLTDNDIFSVSVERCISLAQFFKDGRFNAVEQDLVVAYGISQIIGVLEYLQKMKFVQEDLAEAVYVTVHGEWKIAGLRNFYRADLPEEHPKQLATLLWKIYNNFPNVDVLCPPSGDKLPSEARKVYQKLSNPGAKFDLAAFSKELRTPGEYFDNRLIQTIEFMEEIDVAHDMNFKDILSSLLSHTELQQEMSRDKDTEVLRRTKKMLEMPLDKFYETAILSVFYGFLDYDDDEEVTQIGISLWSLVMGKKLKLDPWERTLELNDEPGSSAGVYHFDFDVDSAERGELLMKLLELDVDCPFYITPQETEEISFEEQKLTDYVKQIKSKMISMHKLKTLEMSCHYRKEFDKNYYMLRVKKLLTLFLKKKFTVDEEALFIEKFFNRMQEHYENARKSYLDKKREDKNVTDKKVSKNMETSSVKTMSKNQKKKEKAKIKKLQATVVIQPLAEEDCCKVNIGLLVINAESVSHLPNLMKTVNNSVAGKLYVRVQGASLDKLLPTIYREASRSCPQLDVRVLLRKDVPSFDRSFGDNISEVETPCPKYKKVVLGGTFDRLHNGHKVLLSKAAMLASQSITCGVTDKDMIKKKTLFELIEPVEKRMEAVEDFIHDVAGTVAIKTERIEDPFGPSIVEEDLEAIILGQTTNKGGEAVNRRRLEKNMTQLDTEMIELLEADDVILAENKISSSSRRREALGTLLRKPNEHRERPLKPYIIGLTGGIASGKSTIGKYLSGFPDYEVIDCDECYARGSDLVRQIDENFPGVVKNGEVNRPELGKRVFHNKDELHKLNNLVWPAVRKEVERRVSQSDKRVVFVEAAALVEAGWDSYMDEVWTVFIPVEEAIRRVLERGLSKESVVNDVTKDEAEARVRSQVSNKERIDKSHVVFCSLWAKEITLGQVNKALDEMSGRI